MTTARDKTAEEFINFYSLLLLKQKRVSVDNNNSDALLRVRALRGTIASTGPDLIEYYYNMRCCRGDEMLRSDNGV